MTEPNIVKLDLDAKRAEVVVDSQKVVTIGGEDYPVPDTLPLYFAEYLINGEFRKAVTLLFGENEPIVGPQLTIDEDGAELSMIARELYGFNLGEASPSSPALNRAGRRSRATSNGSTGSTSRKPASAQKRR